MRVVLDDGAKMPTKAHKFDAGFDLYAKEDFVVPACHMVDGEVEIGSYAHDCGVHIELPQGTTGFIKSKSGLNMKGLTSEGVIDCGYTGSVVVKLYNHTKSDYHFSKGDKITQLVILPIYMSAEMELADSLEDTERGDGGFGSTGR